MEKHEDKETRENEEKMQERSIGLISAWYTFYWSKFWIHPSMSETIRYTQIFQVKHFNLQGLINTLIGI